MTARRGTASGLVGTASARAGTGTLVGDDLSADSPAVQGDLACRPMRADARRNYELLVRSAREVFARDGGATCMETIAKHAGVGVGTLYRHFPKRIDLVEAVYRTDVDDLVAAAEQAVAELEPWPALVSWLDAFVRYAEGKRTFLNELHEAFEKNPQLRVRSRERIDQAMSIVLERAQRAGVVRTDIDGADLMLLVGPICMSSTLTTGQGERLIATVLDGLRRTA